jgi:hypothetical protein
MGWPCPVLEIPHQLLLLRVYRNNGLSLALKILNTRVDVLKLGISIRVRGTLSYFAIALETVPQRMQ